MWPPSSISKEQFKGWVAGCKFMSYNIEQFIIMLFWKTALLWWQPATSLLLLGWISKESYVVVSLWVTKDHHSIYQQITLKVAPVGDPRDSLGITLAPTKKNSKE